MEKLEQILTAEKLTFEKRLLPGETVIDIPTASDGVSFDISVWKVPEQEIYGFAAMVLWRLNADTDLAQKLVLRLVSEVTCNYPYGRVGTTADTSADTMLGMDAAVPLAGLSPDTLHVVLSCLSSCVVGAVKVFESVVPRERRDSFGPAWSAAKTPTANMP